MSGNVTWEMVISLLGIITIVGGFFWRWHAAHSAAITKVERDLQDYKLQVSQTYASKAGVFQQFESVSASINEVGKRMEERLDGMNGRLDRFIEARLGGTKER